MKELDSQTDQQLRKQVSPYLDSLNKLDSSLVCNNPTKKEISSGEYLKEMPK